MTHMVYEFLVPLGELLSREDALHGCDELLNFLSLQLHHLLPLFSGGCHALAEHVLDLPDLLVRQAQISSPSFD
jgi:hypothetical protein